MRSNINFININVKYKQKQIYTCKVVIMIHIRMRICKKQKNCSFKNIYARQDSIP
jgi:hypothetical protein